MDIRIEAGNGSNTYEVIILRDDDTKSKMYETKDYRQAQAYVVALKNLMNVK